MQEGADAIKVGEIPCAVDSLRAAINRLEESITILINNLSSISLPSSPSETSEDSKTYDTALAQEISSITSQIEDILSKVRVQTDSLGL